MGPRLVTDRHQGFTFRDADLSEDVDLDVERRKEILVADARLPTWTHWQALGLPWNAPPDAAKAAYVSLVKVFHPDRYAGKRLGSYRGRLDRIFRRITEARDVLVDETRRVAYVRASAPPEEVAKLEVRKIEDERRAEERRARLTRTNPVLQRAGRVGELVERGRKALAEGRFAQAANDLLAAQALEPRNPEVATLAAEAKRRANLAKVSDLLRKAADEEAKGKAAAALDLYREAVAVDPANLRAAAEAARALSVAGDAAGARAIAEGALKVGPRSGLAHEALGWALEAEGNKKEARKAFERAAELDPSLERAKARAKKWWGILG
jgi:tetratricopeptide (TPR) repeat protein